MRYVVPWCDSDLDIAQVGFLGHLRHVNLPMFTPMIDIMGLTHSDQACHHQDEQVTRNREGTNRCS